MVKFSFLFLCFPIFIFSLTVSDLTLEEKVGQLLCVHFHGEEANQEAAQLIQELHVGGVIYYNWANDLSCPKQVQHLSQGLQDLARNKTHPIPLLIAVDQEGGRVNRLKQGFTIFPGNYALGQTGEWQWGEESAWMMGLELKAVGISVNFAPVVDVYTQPANPIIGIRAFSSDPMQVTQWGKFTLRGYKRAGIIAALKHFPGHGDVQVDSHEAMPMIKKKREILDQVELYPFRMLASQADVMMTAHLLVPELDAEHCVTFSKKVVNDLLREEFGFQGVIITDSLAMEGALSQYATIEETVLKSLEAGHDVILLGGKQLLSSQRGLEFSIDDIKRIHRFLVEAVEQGKISEQQLNASVGRLLALKEKYALFDFKPLNPALLDTDLKKDTHCALAQQIAQRALSVVKGENFLPAGLDAASLLIVAPESLREDLMQTSWQSLQDHMVYFKGFNPDASAIQEVIVKAGKNKKKLVYFSYNAWQFPGQRELFQQMTQHSTQAFAIAVRDALDVDYLSSADVILCTYSPVAFSLEAAFERLTKKLKDGSIIFK